MVTDGIPSAERINWEATSAAFSAALPVGVVPAGYSEFTISVLQLRVRERLGRSTRARGGLAVTAALARPGGTGT